MQKRGFLVLLILFLALLPLSFSAEEAVFSDTVLDREVVEIEDSVFEFRVDSSGKVLIDVDNSGIIIESGECKIKNMFNICVSNVSFAYKNLTTYSWVYKALVKVYHSKSALELTVSMDKKGILVDEEVAGKLTLENSADVPSESVSARLNFSSKLAITKVEGCKQSGNDIYFEGIVTSRNTKECIFTVKGISPGDFELKADSSFFDGAEQSYSSSNMLEGEVYENSLKTSFSGRRIFGINEKFNITIAAENTNPEYDLTVTTLSIKIPENILLLRRPQGTSGTDRLVSWSGLMESETNKTFMLELQSLNTGKYQISIGSSYREGKFLRSHENSFNFSVECECPFLSHEVILDADKAFIRSELVNLGNEAFRSIKASYGTDIPGVIPDSSIYGKIEPLQRVGIFESYVNLPPGSYYFNVTAIYQSSSGEVFLLRDNIPINSGNEVIQAETAQENISAASAPEAAPENTTPQEQAQEPQEVTVTTLEDEKKPMLAYIIAGFIFLLVLVVVTLIILRRRKQQAPIEPPEKIE